GGRSVGGGGSAASADAGGEPRRRGGWRQGTSWGPLRESLAAGVLRLAGYAPDRPLRDPVCGSGTLIIEAALVARSVAPGLGRTFAAEHWPEAERIDGAGQRDQLRAAARAAGPGAIAGRVHSRA